MGNKEDSLEAMRHSLAHITAAAVQRVWPEVQFGVGPVVDNGYYYDIHIPGVTISEDDFEKIEAEMEKIVKEDQKFEKSKKPIDEAIAWAKENNQPFKEELLNDLKRQGTTLAKELDANMMGVGALESAGGLGATKPEVKVADVSFYTNGDFTDLCRGPHVKSTGKVGVFKLDKIAGAYWRGDENKQQMQRLYGVAFASQEELDKHLEMKEKAKQRDHRKLGQEMDLFTFSDMVGSGLPMFTPRGTWLRELLGSYSQQLRAELGFERIWTPHITKPDLYKASGHWDKFGDELFQVKSQETSDSFAMKPMNCPHHTQIYASQPRSYRDLPIRYMENATDYRDEKSGELHGLSRVRAFTQDDSHVFCMPEQIGGEVTALIKASQQMYKTLDMDLRFRLSFRDNSDGFLGDDKLWDEAQKTLEALAKSNDLDYFTAEGEAAFYGPKIDFMATDALGREWQVATVQLDFVQPNRFELEYTDSHGELTTPVMIHCALLGSMERFLSLYIEHVNGHFPFWLAPEQVRILLVNDQVDIYVDKITSELSSLVLNEPLRHNELRFDVDRRDESLGKKIKEAELAKIPVVLIVGPKDESAGEVSVRINGNESKVKLEGLADLLKEQ